MKTIAAAASIGVAMCLLLPPVPVIASDSDNNSRLALIELGVVESSHLGAFETYIFPDNGGSGDSSGSGGGDSDFDILFPDGLLPDNADLQFVPRPGQMITVTFERRVLSDLFDAPSRLSLFFARDANRLKIFAPDGIGIFVDPTDVDLRTEFMGVGVEAAFPLVSYEAVDSRHDIRVGGGVIVYHSISTAHATSEFLDVRISEAETRVAPLASLEYRYRDQRPAGSWLPDGCSFKVTAFKTDRFMTAFASASVEFEF